MATLVIVLGLSGCGDGLSGSTYTNVGGVNSRIEFKSGHKAYVSIGETTYAATYSVDDDKITLDSVGLFGNIVLTIQKDGTITGLSPVNTTLKKSS
ncbi:MAG: hypothetical protein ABSB74_11275 [Tepidisphaeraceae bacterium]